MVGWHHQLNGHEFEQALGDGGGQGSLACCSPWGRKESDTTEQLNNKEEPKKPRGGQECQRRFISFFMHMTFFLRSSGDRGPQGFREALSRISEI